MERFNDGDIVVTTTDAISKSGRVIAINTINKISIAGSWSTHNKPWVYGFSDRKDDDDYYDYTDFRKADREEIAKYNILGKHQLFKVKYQPGDKLVALSEISPAEDGDYILPEQEVIIEDILINRKEPDKSIMWFENIPGVFRMSDNFELK